MVIFIAVLPLILVQVCCNPGSGHIKTCVIIVIIIIIMIVTMNICTEGLGMLGMIMKRMNLLPSSQKLLACIRYAGFWSKSSPVGKKLSEDPM